MLLKQHSPLKSNMSKMVQVLGAFEFSLVKFDVGYPTGEKHKGFGTFALQSVALPNLLAAEVTSFALLLLHTLTNVSKTLLKLST